MSPLRPHVRSAPVFQLPARRPLGARVGAAADDLRGKSVFTSTGEVETYNRGVQQEIRDLSEAVNKNAVKKWGANGYAASIGVPGEVPNDKAAEFRAERAVWGADPSKGVGPYRTMVNDWNAFQGRNFNEDGTVRRLISGGIGDYTLLADLYDAIAAYRVRNNDWKTRFMKETGESDPTPVSPIPDQTKIDEEVKKSSGDKSLLPKGAGDALSALVWTAGGLVLLFFGVSYILPAFLGAAAKSRAAYHGA